MTLAAVVQMRCKYLMTDQFEAQLNLGKAAAAQNRWPEAEGSLRAALAISPDDMRATRALGQLLISQKRFGEAEDVWRKAVALDSEHAESAQVLGLVLLRKRDLEGAAALFTRALALDPAMGESAFNLGRIAYLGDDRAQAAEAFAAAVKAEPGHVKALAALIQTLTELQRETEAVALGAKAIAALEGRTDVPVAGLNEARQHMAHAYRRLGDITQAAACYRAIIAADPSDKVARHLLAAAQGEITEEYAGAFAKNFFENFAETFDEHLVGRLNYAAPGQLAKDLLGLRSDPDAFPAVLDLGCGTGLAGLALAGKFRIAQLVGIDISEKMLAEAAKRCLYTDLIAGDAVAVMAARNDQFDLVVAADVLLYAGSLEPVFTQVLRLLKPDAVFAFSVEISPTADFDLAANGHYRHNRNYIARLATSLGFQIARAVDAPLRKEAYQLVDAHYVYLIKAA